MSRTADYAIQGFLYQFHKTLLVILDAEDESVVTIEGIVEDIEIESAGLIEAIQCKYHESSKKFTNSAIYKPVLQMMQSFVNNSAKNINYVLFAHFPGVEKSGISIDENFLTEALESNNKDYESYIADVKGKIDPHAFLGKLKVEVGPAYDVLVKQVQESLERSGIPKQEIETIIYPNAIQAIADLSIRHDASSRTITKRQLLDNLKEIKKTAISYWTLGLKNKRQILVARKAQLKGNLSKNSRLRHFLIDASSIEGFDSNIVIFISDYLDKYHYKSAHTYTPTFCIFASKEVLSDIRLRLYQKGITTNSGYIEGQFDEALFNKEPIIGKGPDGTILREFSLRLLRGQDHMAALESRKPADLFIFGKVNTEGLNTQDVNVEVLASNSFNEINFLLGIKDVFE